MDEYAKREEDVYEYAVNYKRTRLLFLYYLETNYTHRGHAKGMSLAVGERGVKGINFRGRNVCEWKAQKLRISRNLIS